ncbi:hypothetical protein [Jatrophihabitans sp.]|uniref:hypothetical protein n=1 Tax=Jatrophihabitans sp. TaxID=1932789 RepID=UPI0030C67B8E|nr:hypothetical protein [Jatrophihabitans sp.]
MTAAKAIVAFVLTFCATLLASIQGRADLDTLSTTGWLVIVLSAVVTAGGVYVTSNKPA